MLSPSLEDDAELSELDRLLTEAEGRPVQGWDFSWLGVRLRLSPLPWDYTSLVEGVAREAGSLLDMGTGGGEWLAAFSPRPGCTVATEAWPPNVPVAAGRLAPLGIYLVRVEPAPDNGVQAPGEKRGRLPFRTGAFQVIANRHEAFLATEVARVLGPGGCFVTQQAGYGEDIYALLGVEKPPPRGRQLSLALAVEQVEAAGLEVVGSGQGAQVLWFADVGALAWYLKAIPWIVPGFTLAAFRDRLERLHNRMALEGPLRVHQPRFWLQAVRPPC